jgi:hypothetical protein
MTVTGMFAGALHSRPLRPQAAAGADQVQGQVVGGFGESLNNSWRARVYMGGLDSDGGERWRRL